jgi:hypothetical protein
VDSCPALDVGYLLAKGWLRPGESSSCPLSVGSSPNSEVILLNLRAGAEWLSLSWRSVSRASSGESSGERESVAGIIIPIARVPRYFGGTRPYFVCPGNGAGGCGRRVRKLYFSRGRFLCRHCGKLVYISKYEYAPWQRAHRRANKLWQRLGITRLGAPGKTPGKPEGMLAPAYERLLEAALQAETQATEASTARLLQLIAQLERRHRKPQKTRECNSV